VTEDIGADLPVPAATWAEQQIQNVASDTSHIQDLIPEEELSGTPTSARSPEMIRLIASALTSLGKGKTPAERLKAAGLNPSIYTQVVDEPGFSTALRAAVGRFIVLPEIPALVAEQLRLAKEGKVAAFDRAMELWAKIDESGEEPMLKRLMGLDDETHRANLIEIKERIDEQLEILDDKTSLAPDEAVAVATKYMAERTEEPERAEKISHELIHGDEPDEPDTREG
jgi:hypothetical protein